MANYEKIFAIGFNRTGTTSLHALFNKCGRTPFHGGGWKLEKYDAFSDGHCCIGEFSDFTKLYEKFPNSLYILNTRPLKNWLISRGNHRYVKGKPGFDMNNPYTYVSWIRKRDEHYQNVLKFFIKSQNNLMIVDIEKKDWCGFVSNEIVSANMPDLLKNKMNTVAINPEGLKIIAEKIDEAFKILGYDESRQMSTMIDSPLIDLYKNNLK